jgi:hypothetical protein
MKWPVPVECDTEYGSSWDLRYHLTGDDTHLAAGWTKIKLLEEYVPAEFDEGTPIRLMKSLRNEAKREKALAWLKENLHERTAPVLASIKEQLNKGCKDSDLKQLVYAILHIHEFWVIDSAPDFDTDGFVETETLEQYAERIGVELDDEDRTLDGAVANLVIAAPLTPEVRLSPILTNDTSPEAGNAPVEKTMPEAIKVAPTQETPISDPPEPEQPENNAPISISKLVIAPISQKESVEIQELRPDADPVEVRSALGIGKKKCKFLFKGTLQVVTNVSRETLPPSLLI